MVKRCARRPRHHRGMGHLSCRPEGPSPWAMAAGHGGVRRGERVACHHEALRIGEVCPVCGRGRLYAVPPGVERRLDGNALLSAIRYALEQLRCSTCGAV